MHPSCASTRTVGVQPTVFAYTADTSPLCSSTAPLWYLPSLARTKRTRGHSELQRRAGRTSSVGFLIAALMDPSSVPTSVVSSSPRFAFDTCTLLSSGCLASHLSIVPSILAWLPGLSCLELLSAVPSSTASETRRSGLRSPGGVGPGPARVSFCAINFDGHDGSRSCDPVDRGISPGSLRYLAPPIRCPVLTASSLLLWSINRTL